MKKIFITINTLKQKKKGRKLIMGLTANSTGSKLLQNNIEELKEKCDYTIAIAGNPNVRKIYNF